MTDYKNINDKGLSGLQNIEILVILMLVCNYSHMN